MVVKKRKSVKRSNVIKMFTFFLIGVSLINLVGNFVGISSRHTFFHFGLATNLFVSRYFEDIIVNYTLRIITLGIVTIAFSGFFLLLIRMIPQYKYAAITLGVLAYIGDYVAFFFLPVYETPLQIQVIHSIHLLFFAYLLIIFLYIFITLPPRKVKYDFA